LIFRPAHIIELQAAFVNDDDGSALREYVELVQEVHADDDDDDVPSGSGSGDEPEGGEEAEEEVEQEDDLGDQPDHLRRRGLLQTSATFPKDFLDLATKRRVARCYSMWNDTVKIVCKEHAACTLMVRAVWFADHTEMNEKCFDWLGAGREQDGDAHAEAAAQLIRRARAS